MAIIQLPSAAGSSPLKSGKPDEDSSSSKRVAQAIDAIAQFIPADLLAIYVAGVDILNPLPIWGEWTVVGVCILLIPVLFWLGAKLPAANARAFVSPERSTLRILMCLSIVAFLAWVWALPHGPFAQLWGDSATKIGAWVAIILSVLLPLIARKFNLITS